MKVELDKTGMVHLVLGTYPSHDMQESLIKRNLGYREKEVWYWDEAELKKLDNPQLYTLYKDCLLYTSPSPRDRTRYRMPSSA